LLAGLETEARIVPEISEWDYGEYEGRTTEEIRRERPGWTVWTGECPGGEGVEDVGRRADWAISRLRAIRGDSLLFSHGHFLRVLAARWIGQPASVGRSLALETGAISVLGWERENPVVWSWNRNEE
jgi:probable phosphoglycerate mutase